MREGPCARLLCPTSLLLQVGEVYQQLHAAMSQAPVKENIPYSWASLACVKAHHYRALAHYFVATLLIDHQCKARGLGGSGFGQGCGFPASRRQWAGWELSAYLGDAHSLGTGGGKTDGLGSCHTGQAGIKGYMFLLWEEEGKC